MASSKKVVLSLDPATTYGYALFEVPSTSSDARHENDDESSIIRIHKLGIFKARSESERQNEGEICIDVLNSVSELIDEAARLAADLCCLLVAYVEDYYFGRRKCNGANINLYVRAATYMALAQTGIPYTRVHPSQWKSWVMRTNRHRGGTKEDIKRTLQDRFRFSFPPYTMCDDRKVKFKYDVSDALGIGLFGVSAKTAWRIKYASDAEPA